MTNAHIHKYIYLHADITFTCLPIHELKVVIDTYLLSVKFN